MESKIHKFRPRLPDGFVEVIPSLRKIPLDRIKSFVNRERRLAKGFQRIFVCSDIHGVFVDYDAFFCFIEVLKTNKADLLIINGDFSDLPLLSRHFKKFWYDHPVLAEYTETKEIELIRDVLFKAIYEAVKDTGCEVLVRYGNHDERYLNPLKGGTTAERILSIHNAFQTTSFPEMLGCNQYGFKVDETLRQRYELSPGIQVVHGISTAIHAGKVNLRKFGGGISVVTGHTHALELIFDNTLAGGAFSLQTGCLRTITNIEYFIPGSPPKWQQGFGVIDLIDTGKNRPLAFPQAIKIEEGRCMFEGQLYQAPERKKASPTEGS
ncbi:MAG: metallophosphoesterase [Bacteroidota bacterium]